MKLNVLDNIKGHWKYQKTIYDVNNRQINNYKQCIDISIDYTNSELIINQKTLSDKKIYSSITLKSNILNKMYNYYNLLYILVLESSNQLNIIYKKNFIQFQEKICIINSNFFIVISIMKQNHKYLSISFTSFIKIVS